MPVVLKVNLALSLFVGLLVAGIAAVCGSSVWWVWGLGTAGCESFALAIVQGGCGRDAQGD
jgi:hypothetical protein